MIIEPIACWQEKLPWIIGKSLATISLYFLLNKFSRSIRDACRQIPIVSKNVLIEIARKRQERKMVNQFRKYWEQ